MLARSSRLGMLGELTASIAHEVNQPLGAILSNTEAAELLMKSDQPPLEEIRAILSDIRRDDLRAGEVIRQVRQMVSSGESKRIPVDMAEVTNGVLAMVRHDCKRRGVHLVSEIAEEPPLVSGERVQLEQVLLNLLLNAMDAVAAPGIQFREVRVSLEALRKQVFESFFTTKPDGMGLGLALSRTIAEAHGGSLSAEDSASSGATIRLILPALHET
jgi:C4-dicarboxylate-specific signal transduction histidine kinase